jgi:hypothetical protein
MTTQQKPANATHWSTCTRRRSAPASPGQRSGASS